MFLRLRPLKEPGNIEFPRLEPHLELKTSLLCCSEVWDDFEVISLVRQIGAR